MAQTFNAEINTMSTKLRRLPVCCHLPDRLGSSLTSAIKSVLSGDFDFTLKC